MTNTSIEPAETVDQRPNDSVDPHADKYNDPRAKITARGIGIGLLVLAFAIVGAAASIYGRRTRLVESTRFWGDETILALQLAERIELLPRVGREFPEVDLTGTPGLGHLRRALLDERNFDWDTENDRSVIEQATQDRSAINQDTIPEVGPDQTIAAAGPAPAAAGPVPADADPDSDPGDSEQVALSRDEVTQPAANSTDEPHGNGESESGDKAFVVTLRLTDPTAGRFKTVMIDIDLNQGWLGHSDEPHSVRFAERKRSGLRHYLVTIMNKETNRYDLRDR